jgi:hypothetical protein
MKIRLTAILLGATSGLFIPAMTRSQESHAGASRGAEIVIGNSVHDFGKIRAGEIATAAFSVRNSGDDTLELSPGPDEEKRLHLRIPESSVEPGESSELEVTMETEGLIGNVMDSIPVYTNDPEQREIFLKIRATVQPIIIAYPPIFSVGQVAKEDSASGSVPLMGVLADEDRLSDLIVEPSSPSVRAWVAKKQLEDGIRPVLEFVLLPDLKPGDIQEYVTITSKDPPSQAYLRLFGRKNGDISITPDKFVIMLNEDGEIEDYSVTLESRRKFHITGAEDSNDLLAITTRTIVPDSKYEVVARLKELVAANAMGVVRVHTDLEEEALIEIPFLVGVPRSGN